MKKTLIIVAHPNIDKSNVNKRWIAKLKHYPDQFTVHELYEEYPDGKINVEKEQLQIENHGNLILQFPIYWFNCPPLLKQWLDEVFTYGWAYGSSGDKLQNRKIALAISAGIRETDFSATGLYQATMEDVLRPFELTMTYVNANYRSFFPFYGAETNVSPEKIEDNAQDYIHFLSHL